MDISTINAVVILNIKFNVTKFGYLYEIGSSSKNTYKLKGN